MLALSDYATVTPINWNFPTNVKHPRNYQGKLGDFSLVKNAIGTSRTGWLDTYRKYMKLHAEEFYVAGMNKLPRIPFGREQGITDLANRMAVAWHADGFRSKFSPK